MHNVLRTRSCNSLLFGGDEGAKVVDRLQRLHFISTQLHAFKSMMNSWKAVWGAVVITLDGTWKV